MLLGTLAPTGNFPIYNTIANKFINADYTFTFIPDSLLIVGGYVEIEFPHQY